MQSEASSRMRQHATKDAYFWMSIKRPFLNHLKEVSAAGVLLEDGYHVGVVEERGGARRVVVDASLVRQVTESGAGRKHERIWLGGGHLSRVLTEMRSVLYFISVSDV